MWKRPEEQVMPLKNLLPVHRLPLTFCASTEIIMKVKVAQSCLTLFNPMDYTVHGIIQARILEWVAFPFSRGIFPTQVEPRSPALQTNSLPTEPQGKPKNTGVGSLSLLHWIFPTQEMNWGLLHCRWILYQLNYQGDQK